MAGGVWGREHRRLTTGITLVVSAIAFEALAVATVLPATVADLGGLHWYGWAFSGMFLATILAATAGGRAADRRGPAPPFVAGVVLFAAGLAVAGLAPSMPVLVAGRVVQGLGSGLVGAVAYVTVGRGYPDHLRPRMLAILSSAWVLPALIGPGVSGLVAERIGWRVVFLGLIPLLPLATALAGPAMARIRPVAAPADRAELWCSARLAAGIAVLLAGLAAGTPLGHAGVVAGAVLAVPAGRRLLALEPPKAETAPAPAASAPSPDPPASPAATGSPDAPDDPGLAASPDSPAAPSVSSDAASRRGGDPATVRLAVVLLGLVSIGYFGAETFLPLTLNLVRDTSLPTGGLVLTAASVSWTAGSWAQARLTRNGRRRSLVLAGTGVLVAGVSGVATVLAPAVPLVAAPLAWGLAGFGMGLTHSTLSLIVLEAADPARQGQASALLQQGTTVGIALGSGVGGALVALGERLAWPTVAAVGIIDAATATVLVAALVVALRLPRRAGTGAPAGRVAAGRRA